MFVANKKTLILILHERCIHVVGILRGREILHIGHSGSGRSILHIGVSREVGGVHHGLIRLNKILSTLRIWEVGCIGVLIGILRITILRISILRISILRITILRTLRTKTLTLRTLRSEVLHSCILHLFHFANCNKYK